MSIRRLHSDILAAGIPIDGVSGSSAGVRVDYKAEATTPQRTQGAALVAAFDWGVPAERTWIAQQEKGGATASIDRGALQAGSAVDRIARALAMTMLNEFNTHSQQTTDMLAAIAAASSLADLKTRMALVSAIPQRTAAQLVSSIKANIAATGE